ncbi:hypothetical protein [Mucilaginibacter sp. dw_454]|uniref:hypothetical protein n=1 Tax=Mucilaginibacter sp. dw_454 TaxID=2720079 RepID=UPI001BD5FFD8|nr:hypothetical protein [Mucilaginibacter sp. dw_454]
MQKFVKYIVLSLLFQVILPRSSFSQKWAGPTFKEFSGVNKMDASDPFFSNGIVGWERPFGIFINKIQPSRGVWNANYVAKFQKEALDLQKTGSAFLPELLYMGWAGQDLHNTDRSAPAVESDWTDYVAYVVDNLHKAPYNLQYFQIWNEAVPSPKGWDVDFTEKGFFYDGNFDDYINKIHLPASKIIRDAGGKVVYGGYPGCKYTSPENFVKIMNHYNAWGNVDVIDLHYFHWWDLDYIRKAAIAAGYPNLAYWQTEWGYTTNPIAISSEYPFAIYWALTSGLWNAPDKFKYFYYSGYYTPDAGDEIPAHKKGLYDGKTLTAHGLILKNMAQLLGGGILSAITGLKATGLSGKHSSVVGFKVGALKATIAIGLDSADYAASNTTTLSIPIPKSKIVKAERVDLDGSNIVDITGALKAKDTTHSNLIVSTKEIPGSNADKWNAGAHGESDLAVFYVRLTIAGSYSKK